MTMPDGVFTASVAFKAGSVGCSMNRKRLGASTPEDGPAICLHMRYYVYYVN